MTLREELAADTANAIAIYGETFEWQGTRYPCVSRDQPTMRELQEEGGFVDGVNKALTAGKSAFPGYAQGQFPQDGDLVEDSRYQIKKRNGQDDPAAAQLILYLGSVDS